MRRIADLWHENYPQLICGTLSGILGAIIALKLFL